ncbi:MAG: chitobiase/beta-hexosaminidase C-terminal domain-containing protein, partial [Myxococcales bacterium]
AFNGEVEVTLATDRDASLIFTLDGSEPSGDKAQTQPAPVKLKLSATTTLRFFSRTAEGAVEQEQSAQYVRAGGPKGTVSGVVVVGSYCVGQQIAVLADGRPVELGRAAEAGELPFKLENVADGAHRLQAISDRNDDGRFTPFIDFTSETFQYALDSKDPFKASVEDVKLYLGESRPGLCTISGKVRFDKALGGQNLSVVAMSPSAFSGGMDPQALMAQLGGGYRIFTNDTDTEYPYVLTDLEDGTYMPVAILTGLGGGSFGMNMLANPLRTVSCSADTEQQMNFRYGPSVVQGTVTLKPATPPQGFVWGMIAARNFSLLEGAQVLLMPAFFNGSSTELQAAYSGQAMRNNAQFDLRAFTSLSGQDPISSSLMWVMNPFAPEQPHKKVTTASTPVQADFTVP